MPIVPPKSLPNDGVPREFTDFQSPMGLAERLGWRLVEAHAVCKTPRSGKRNYDPFRPPHLTLQHWVKMRSSGLSAATILASKAYSELDPAKVRILLNGAFYLDSTVLVFPFFDRYGKRINYNIVRPDSPRYVDGKLRKYENPIGMSSVPYFPPLPIMWKHLNTRGMALGYTEGILKALANTQCGWPTIGLGGAWNWVKGGSDPKELVEALDMIDWRRRTVLTLFDFDDERKFNINHSAAALAKVMTNRGAHNVIINIPAGARDDDDRHQKQAIDDYNARHGQGMVRRMIGAQLVQPAVIHLDQYRAKIGQARIDSLTVGGVNLDRSQCGAGKTHADGAALKALEDGQRSLIIAKTHENIAQITSGLVQQGIPEEDIMSPPLLNEDNCQQYAEVVKIRDHTSLVPQQVLCPSCPHKEMCEYKACYNACRKAKHIVATHKHLEVAMPLLTANRHYISVHEDALNTLAPQITAQGGFDGVALVAVQAFDEATSRLERDYYSAFERAAKRLNHYLKSDAESVEVPLLEEIPTVPTDFSGQPVVQQQLYEVIKCNRTHPDNDAINFALAYISGELRSVYIHTDYHKGKDGADVPKRTIVGQYRSYLECVEGTTWINDASANLEYLQEATGQTIIDRTPEEQLKRYHKVLQIPRDIKRTTSIDTAVDILRGIMHDTPHSRIGVITHQHLAKDTILVDALGTAYGGRIAKVSYFGSGESRGSNEWHDECDALVILGTPRVPPHAIRKQLFRVNRRAHTMREEQAGWSPVRTTAEGKEYKERDVWSGTTTTGTRRIVKTGHYTNHDWHASYQSFTVAELQQCIGRARTILPNGIPCYVVSTEELGEQLVDEGTYEPLTERQADVLAVLGNKVTKTSEVAEALGVSNARAKEILAELVAAGRVVKIGQRGGWQRRFIATIS